jgi:hypothetical protein
MQQKNKPSTPKPTPNPTPSKTLIPKITHLNLKPYLPPNLPPIISIDPGPTNSALVSTQPPIALQFTNDTNSQLLTSTLKNLLHTHNYSLILIENFNLYSPRKHASDCLICLGYLIATANAYSTPYKLINKPRKNYSPIQLPHKLNHIHDALNLLFYFLSSNTPK